MMRGERIGHIRHAVAALLASTATASATVARAQDAAAAPAASLPSGEAPDGAGTDSAGVNGTDIVVTATRRSERLQDVPISIQALGAATLEQHQVKNVDDYIKVLPSVSYQSFGPGQSQLYFRGITTGADGLRIGPQPTTAVYIDEIPVTTIGQQVDVHIYDVDRVEALSGPQGTLFGSSSEAGTLRIITNKPDSSRFSAGYDIEGNKFGDGQYGGVGNGFVNVPLGEDAAIRLVGFYQHDGGYIDNVPGTRTFALGDTDDTTNLTLDNRRFAKRNFNHADTYGGRVALRYDIDDNWTATPQVTAQHLKTKGNFIYDPRKGYLNVTDFVPEYNLDKWYQAALTIQGKLSNWDVTYAGSYFQRRTENKTDYSYYSVAYDSYLGSYATYFPTGDPANPFLNPTQQQYLQDDYTKQTHEIRISSPAHERARMTAGLFLNRQTDNVRADYFVAGATAFPPDDPNYLRLIPGLGDDVFATRVRRIDRDYAAFLEASFDLLPNLTFTGGLRGYIFKNTLRGFSGFGERVPVNSRSDDSGETHKLNVTWKVTPRHMVYATYSTGFRPGGGNRLAGFAAYKTDTLDNYEIGFKTSWLGNKLRVNGAFFYENWNNPQLTYSPLDANGVNITDNVPGARSKGFEGDASLTLGQLVLSGSGAYVDAYTTKDFESTSGITPKGSRLPIQPRVKINGTARYGIPIGDLKAYVQGTVLYQSNTRSFLLQDQFENVGTLPGFTSFDFAAGTTLPNRMTVDLFIQNAFKKHGQLSRNTACTPSLTVCALNYRVFPLKPQIFGVRLGQRF